MRLADDKIASKPIEEAVQNCSLSAFCENGAMCIGSARARGIHGGR
eukprot:COSAG02_NODE_27568_length_606_cov_2.370809_1_plen_45_part_10